MIARKSFGWAAGLLALQFAMAWSQVPPKFPSRIKSVTAKLYFSDSGTFSGNILDQPDLALWNTIIGEGQSGGPSEATLIEVEVDGDSRGKRHPQRAIDNYDANEREACSVTRHTGPLYFGQNGKHFEAVWLYDSGCQPGSNFRSTRQSASDP